MEPNPKFNLEDFVTKAVTEHVKKNPQFVQNLAAQNGMSLAEIAMLQEQEGITDVNKQRTITISVENS